MPHARDLSILIVNWNSTNFLQRCLSSIYRNCKDLSLEIIVIDNASFDGCGEMVRTHFPEVQFLQEEENRGFARANNLAFEKSSGRNILLLNPDTEIEERAIQNMVCFLDSEPTAGIVGCKLLNTDLSIQTSCIQPYPTILNQMLDAEILANCFPTASIWGRAPLYLTGERPASVQVVSGACLMVRRGVFESVGQLTTDYFMYAEDTDLCFKVGQAGFKTFYLGNNRVVHHGGQSSSAQSASFFADLMMRQSLLQFMQLRRGRTYALAYRVGMAVVSFVRLLIVGLGMTFSMRSGRRDSLRHAFKRWTNILGWALGI